MHERATSRRRFLVGSGTGCLGLVAQAGSAAEQTPAGGAPAVNWNSDQVFNFAYRDWLIPLLLGLAARVGREKLVELLKAGTDETFSTPGAWPRLLANLPKGFWAEALKAEDSTDAQGAVCKKITRCPWAEVFRQAGAGDFGYAAICHGDFALARLRNQRLERTKTLMQGGDCCDFRWTKQA
jgi:hypothetical protein